MSQRKRVRVIRPEDRSAGYATGGMTREEAFVAGALWAGMVHTEAGAVSDWHHHGDYDSSIYLLSGRLRMESGPAGADVVEAGPGDFLHVPAGVVHRESNPAEVRASGVLARAGTGEPVVNVAGPEPA